jgi:hypothetical protein
MVAADVQRLDALWAEPSRVAASDMPWLASLVEANPAALPLWWLYLRAVQKAESPQFTQVLHRCAALSPDRSALMAWVEEPLQPVASGEAASSDLPRASGEAASSDLPRASGEAATSDSSLASPVSSDSSLASRVSSDSSLASRVSSDSSLASRVSSDSSLASGEAATSDSPLVPGNSSEVIDQEPQETNNEQQQTSSEEPQVTRSAEPPVRPEPKATNAATLNLDALPERVREQILRARAARAQLAEVGFGSAPVKPEVTPVAPVQPEVAPVAPVAPVPSKAEPKAEPVVAAPAPVALTPEPKAAPAVRTSEPAAKKPKATPQTTSKIETSSETASPDLPTPPASPASLSPFAQFVANLESTSRTPKGDVLIDQFLAVNPRISPMAKDAPAPVVRTEPDAQVTGLVTETLARMYAEQGHVAKAIQAYEILKLRVPEKSSIFAARIEALKTK